VSRIDLDLIPTHPDRNGGLGFLGGTAYAYSPLLASFAARPSQGSSRAGSSTKGNLADFKLEILLLVAICMLLVLGPMSVFALQIRAAQRKGSGNTAPSPPSHP